MMRLSPAFCAVVVALALAGCARKDGGAPVEICHGRPQHQLKSVKPTPSKADIYEAETTKTACSTEDTPISESKPQRARNAPNFATPINESLYKNARKSYTQDGVLIPVKTGTPFVAIDGGAVIFAGSDVELGNAVIVRHADEWISVYSHAKSLKVSTGSIVKKGQTLGFTGQTGKATKPQLHLEIRHKNKIVSPRKVF